MPNELLIKIGGVFHLICALSHIIFPKTFNWDENLKELPAIKKRVIKQLLNTSNFSVLLFWLIFAYLPFFYSKELLTSQIGKALLTGIIIFWSIRIFIIQPLFSGLPVGYFIFGVKPAPYNKRANKNFVSLADFNNKFRIIDTQTIQNPLYFLKYWAYFIKLCARDTQHSSKFTFR